MAWRTQPGTRQRGFSRTDLLFVLAGLAAALLLGGLGLQRIGERARIARCAHNLALLGEGLHSYAEAHAQSLPPAVVWTPQLKTTWDTCLMTTLLSTSSKRDTRPALFVCPSDRVKRDSPRSYAMSQHDMSSANWPPGPGNATGLGLVWTKEGIAKYLPESQRSEGPTLSELSLVKLSMIPQPADTLLLGELISAENKFRNTAHPGIDGSARQLEPFQGKVSTFHNGRFNFLMVDGHVERLSPLETGGFSGSRGIWTIRAGD